MLWHADHALHLSMMTIIKDFLRKLLANAIVLICILINLWDVVPNSIKTCNNGSKDAETKFMTLEM